MVHSRDVKDCGDAPQRKSTAKIPYIMMWQHQLDNTNQGGRKKYFYKFVKALRKDPCSIPTLVKDAILTWISLTNMNQHFYSVFNKESSFGLPDMSPSPHPEMASFDISIARVVKLLQEVYPFKAVGPDGIPPRS